MSHYMTALAMRQTGLKPAAKLVLYWLAYYHDDRAGHCEPSLSALASVCGISKTSVKKAVRSLCDAGLVDVIERKVGDVLLTNQYRLRLDKIGGAT